MPDTIIESVLTGKLDCELLFKWLKNESIEEPPEDCILYCCNRNEFVAYFLSYLRQQTDSILQTNSNAPPPLHQTPEKVHIGRRKHRRSISDPTSDDRKDTLTVKSQSLRSQESPSKDRKRTGRRVKTKLFDDSNTTISSDESRISTGMERVFVSSTPLKNAKTDPPISPVTPLRSLHERCDTPRLSHRHRSHEKSCLGDYIVGDFAQKNSKKKKGRHSSDGSEPQAELDISNSDIFPEIGARKASSLRSDKRRIKPTNIDKSTSRKSMSLNSFNSDYFQQSSVVMMEDNAVFKQQNLTPNEQASGFEAERSMLKQERHKLMEKFNILNTNTSPKPVAPLIKITQKESFENAKVYIKSDATKIVFKDKLDLLADIYDVLVDNNLILSVNTEIYFLISILLSKQCEDDYTNVESKLSDNNLEYLLKSIHNSTYFAVKCLWNMRVILEVVLDKNSLKILGENKKVRSFYPDLAKFLLNSYGLKCEMEGNHEKKSIERLSNGVICFNHETDNVDNFPSMLSFQNFKKQRDMFYEIVRWYQETLSTGGSRSSFRARIKTLLSAGVSAANFSHLAALFTQHMLAECLPANTQESKLSKLHRRLTCPNAPESHRSPHFSTKESFYKEFILSADNEALRVHIRDAIAYELVALDSTPLGNDDKSNSNTDISKDYHTLAKKLALLAKFLGYMASLPYTLAPEPGSKPGHLGNAHLPPKEKVLENSKAVREWSQPTIDLKGMLTSAYQSSRLIVTLPWLVHYLSMLDYTTLRIKYYQELLKTLRHIYLHRLKINDGFLKKNTVIFLKCTLGWLFDLPHFPQDITCDSSTVISEVNIDCCDVIDEVILFDLCPYLRDVNVLLSTCKVSHEQKEMGTFRHITPVSLTLNAEDRMRNKERELQARLEEEMLKSQPSSTRRVLEVVTERVASATVRQLARPLASARENAHAKAAVLLAEKSGSSQAFLLQSLQALYAAQLAELRNNAMEMATATIKHRASSALKALLPHAPLPLQALVANNCLNKVRRWLQQNWNSTDILCKDIEAEMRNLTAVGPAAAAKAATADLTIPEDEWLMRSQSPAACLINLKEQICLLLEDEEPTDLTDVLSTCASCCLPDNLLNRPPTQRALLQLSVDLCIVYVSKKPLQITDAFLAQLHTIWNTCCPDRKPPPPSDVSLPERRPDLSPEFRNFDDDRAPTPVSDDDGVPITNVKIVTSSEVTSSEASVVNRTVNIEIGDEKLEFFNRILCPRNIVLLSSSKCNQSDVWEALASVLVFLLKNAYLSEDSLTEQCLAVYRQDWTQTILENLSTCMKSVSSRWSRSSTGKFTLFLDFLAEYCGNMDYEPVDSIL